MDFETGCQWVEGTGCGNVVISSHTFHAENRQPGGLSGGVDALAS